MATKKTKEEGTSTSTPEVATPPVGTSTTNIPVEPPAPPVEIKNPFGAGTSDQQPTPAPDLLKQLAEDMAEMKEQNRMLLQIADKTQLAKFYSKNVKKLPSISRLNLMGGKVIMAWRMTKNDVHKDALTQRWQEIQEVELALEDGTVLKMPYTDYVRQYTQEEARVISTTKDENENTVLRVARLSDGKEYNIDVRYVN